MAEDRVRAHVANRDYGALMRRYPLQSPPEERAELGNPVYSAYRAVAVRLAADACVLDVGCGNGKVGQFLARESGATVDGVEPADDRRRVAVERLRYVSPIPAGSEIDQHLSSTYDAITFFDVLEHIANPAEVLAWARDLLAPDGVIYALVPNSANWRFRLRVARGDWSMNDHGLFDRTHLRFFDVRSVRGLQPPGTRVVLQQYHAPGALPLRSLVKARPNLFALHTLLGWQRS